MMLPKQKSFPFKMRVQQKLPYYWLLSKRSLWLSKKGCRNPNNPRKNEIIPLVSKITCLSLKSSNLQKRYLHLKKTGCWRRNVPKEDLVAEDKPRLVSSIVGPIVGNGTEEAIQEAQMVGFIFSFSLRDFFLKLSPIPDGILSSLTILGLGIRLSLVLDEVGTGRFKTGCRRRNVIKEDFIFIVPISVSVFNGLTS